MVSSRVRPDSRPRERRPDYTMYIDESGNHDLNCERERYLGLTGVICSRQHMDAVVAPSMEQLKKRFWPSLPVGQPILHRKDIVWAKGPFRNLHDQCIRAAFDKCLLALLRDWQYTLVSVVIDKHAHRNMYTRPYHAYHYCLQILLERYVMFLEHRSKCGSVLAEARGKKMDQALEKEYRSILDNGTGFSQDANVNGSRYQRCLTNSQIRLDRKTANQPGLQIADLLVHESRDEVLAHFGHDRPAPRPFQQRLVEIIRAKYYRHPTRGVIDGCGRKVLPR